MNLQQYLEYKIIQCVASNCFSFRKAGTLVQLPLIWLVKIVAYFLNELLCLRLERCRLFLNGDQGVHGLSYTRWGSTCKGRPINFVFVIIMIFLLFDLTAEFFLCQNCLCWRFLTSTANKHTLRCLVWIMHRIAFTLRQERNQDFANGRGLKTKLNFFVQKMSHLSCVLSKPGATKSFADEGLEARPSAAGKIFVFLKIIAILTLFGLHFARKRH